MEKCHKGCNQVVISCNVNVKHRIDDQTIIDDCQISKMKIGFIESVNGSYSG